MLGHWLVGPLVSLLVGPLVGRSVTHFFGVFRAVFASLLLPNRTRLILPCIWPCSFAKTNTILVFFMYQVFIFLLSHLHYFVHFLFSFVENLFMDHPISFRILFTVTVDVNATYGWFVTVCKKCNAKA